jgi:hypothetical protein
MKAAFRVFESYEESWDVLFKKAAAFAGEQGPECVINVSHSENIRSQKVVVVWYWEAES